MQVRVPVPMPRTIALEGARNFRDLGGYPTISGGRTRYGIAYRSAALSGMTRADRERLLALRLTACIDLRSGFELSEDDQHGGFVPWTRTIRLPVLDVANAAAYAELLRQRLVGEPAPAGLARLYAHMLDTAGVTFAAATKVVATSVPSVHLCTTGKDRTGVLSALLLRLAGVPDTLIAWDWACSMPLPRERGAAAPINAALAHLDARWGGAVHYLRSHGVAAELLEAFREMFVAPDRLRPGVVAHSGHAQPASEP